MLEEREWAAVRKYHQPTLHRLRVGDSREVGRVQSAGAVGRDDWCVGGVDVARKPLTMV